MVGARAGSPLRSSRTAPCAWDAGRVAQRVLATHGITCSMSRRGNCYDNAVMEAFFSTVKSELGERFDSHSDAKAELFDYLEVFYDQRRLHSSAGRTSPAAYERKMAYAA